MPSMRTVKTTVKSNVPAMLLGLLAGGALVVSTTAATAQTPRIEVGTLTCHGEGTVGLIVGSKESMRCTYKPANGRHAAHYDGTTTRVGLDVGVRGASTLIWTVL